MIENEYTLIQVSRGTASKLKKRAITPNETYDNILKRMLEEKQ